MTASFQSVYSVIVNHNKCDEMLLPIEIQNVDQASIHCANLLNNIASTTENSFTQTCLTPKKNHTNRSYKLNDLQIKQGTDSIYIPIAEIQCRDLRSYSSANNTIISNAKNIQVEKQTNDTLIARYTQIGYANKKEKLSANYTLCIGSVVSIIKQTVESFIKIS